MKETCGSFQPHAILAKYFKYLYMLFINRFEQVCMVKLISFDIYSDTTSWNKLCFTESFYLLL